jgi:ribosomal protein L40E
MRDVSLVAEKADIGGRRLGFDRRKTLIVEYEPERRSGQDRRARPDRRGPGQGDISYLRRNLDRYIEFRSVEKMKCPKCQSENPRTRKFCRRCGKKLVLYMAT